MMPNITNTQMIIQVNDYLGTWIEGFIIDRKARGLTNNTLLYYSRKLKQFNEFAESQAVTRISQIDSYLICQFLLWLETTGHNEGGRLTTFRAVRVFLHWYEEESDEITSIHNVKAPGVALEPLEGVSLDTVLQRVKVCERGTFIGAAILLGLLDTGARAREFLYINLAEVDQTVGDILIRSGKGIKPRTVYLGRTARKALRQYLKHRNDDHPGLWINRNGDRLHYSGLSEMIKRRSKQTGIKPPPLHSFRRGFTIIRLRAGVDLYTLARLLGHEGIDVLKRYLKLTDQDTAEAHRRASPVDNLLN